MLSLCLSVKLDVWQATLLAYAPMGTNSVCWIVYYLRCSKVGRETKIAAHQACFLLLSSRLHQTKYALERGGGRLEVVCFTYKCLKEFAFCLCYPPLITGFVPPSLAPWG